MEILRYLKQGIANCSGPRLAGQAVTLVAVLILLTPLRPSSAPVQSAGVFLPLLSAQGVADNQAFHRINHDEGGRGGAPESLFRAPESRLEGTSAVRIVVVRKNVGSLALKLGEPSKAWLYLNRAVRGSIDEADAAGMAWQRLVIHGSGTQGGNASLLSRYEREVRLVDPGKTPHFVITNGVGESDGKIIVTPLWKSTKGNTDQQASIAICLMGGFQHQGPTEAQLQALRELVDYLRMKVGMVPVSTHAHELGREVTCMDPAFPETQILEGFNAPN